MDKLTTSSIDTIARTCIAVRAAIDCLEARRGLWDGIYDVIQREITSS